MKKILGLLVVLVLVAGCGDEDPTGPNINIVCQETANDNIVTTVNNDCSTRTADPFVIEPFVVESPAEE